MSAHTATISWKSDGPDFLKGRFHRGHTWTFDGGVSVPASASPAVVPAPYSRADAVDPEEALVAALSSCHMLTFLHEARKAGFQVDSYEDTAVGTMAKNEHGVPWVAEVVLAPRIGYGGEKRPSHDEEARLHHLAHEGCFIAQSVKTAVRVDGF